jgi:hypothetical protein
MNATARTAPDARRNLVALFALAAALLASLAHGAVPRGAPLAVSRFDRAGLSRPDSLTAANDTCVDRIAAHHPAALKSCRFAVQRARGMLQEAVTFGSMSGRRDLALVVGNLAVAEAMTGDAERAHATAVRAVAYAPDETLLVSNLRILETRRLASARAGLTVN